MPRRLPLVVALAVVASVLTAVTLRFADSPGSKQAVTATAEPVATGATPEAPVDSLPATTATSGGPPTTPTTAKPSGPASSSAAGAPALADDAKGLAAQIASAEKAIADPSAPPGELYRAAHVQQLAYRRIVTRPELKDETLANLPAALRQKAAADILAGTKLRAMITKPKDTLPPWRIVAPAPAEELLAYYQEAEATTGIAWQYFAAINLVETRMGRIRGLSSAGAQGPMQFMPATWAAYGAGDINSDHDSIAAAGRYLKRNGGPENMRRALWNYNHDYRYVDAVTLHAQRMQADPRAYYAYHQWQVYYLTVNGDVWLPEGYDASS